MPLMIITLKRKSVSDIQNSQRKLVSVRFKLIRDMVFWLIGANAPIMKIHYNIFKKIEKIEKNFRVCI
jgi:hypothetical protein